MLPVFGWLSYSTELTYNTQKQNYFKHLMAIQLRLGTKG